MNIKFGTDGFRGVIGKDFTFSTALEASRLAMEYFSRTTGNALVVGYDTRFLSREIAEAVSAEAASFGYASECASTFCPSPAVSLYTHRQGLNFGIMITASHNPPLFNGVKFKENFGGSALAETMRSLAHAGRSLRRVRRRNAVRPVDLRAAYLAELRRYLPPKGRRPLRLLVDPMHGATMGYMGELFDGSRVVVDEIRGSFNPSFGGVNPEPVEENLLDTRRELLRGGYDVAFAFDGDGDRIACFDEQGTFYSSQRLLPLFLHYLATVEKKRGDVVKTVSASSMIRHVAESVGVTVHEVPIGFKNIVPFFLSGKAMLGGEESGGIGLSGYIPERDGMFCALFLLKILAHYGKPLSRIWHELEKTYGTFRFRREDYHFSNENAVRKILNNLDFEQISGVPVRERNFTDGRKFILSDRSFLLVRVSGTEPVVRVYAEAESDGELAAIFDWTRRQLREKGVAS